MMLGRTNHVTYGIKKRTKKLGRESFYPYDSVYFKLLGDNNVGV